MGYFQAGLVYFRVYWTFKVSEILDFIVPNTRVQGYKVGDFGYFGGPGGGRSFLGTWLSWELESWAPQHRELAPTTLVCASALWLLLQIVGPPPSGCPCNKSPTI